MEEILSYRVGEAASEKRIYEDTVPEVQAACAT